MKGKWIALVTMVSLIALGSIGCGSPDAGTVEETVDMAAKVEESAGTDDIVILYTNDVHTYVDGPISYDVIAAIKKELQDEARINRSKPYLPW